jgi:hypothetical protein
MNSLNSEAGSNLEQIAENNHLDIQLYQFAKELFFKRIEFFIQIDKSAIKFVLGSIAQWINESI